MMAWEYMPSRFMLQTSHYDKEKFMPYICIGWFYDICIPYNDDTKHLLGTTDEAPEYYRYLED